jgi:hypothetical protein
MKDVDNSDNREKVKNNIIRNFNLMWLNSNMIPEDVREDMEKEILRGISLSRKSVTLDRIKILEGTEWLLTDTTPTQFDPFSFLN